MNNTFKTLALALLAAATAAITEVLIKEAAKRQMAEKESPRTHS